MEVMDTMIRRRINKIYQETSEQMTKLEKLNILDIHYSVQNNKMG